MTDTMGSHCSLHCWSSTKLDQICPYCQKVQTEVNELRAERDEAVKARDTWKTVALERQAIKSEHARYKSALESIAALPLGHHDQKNIARTALTENGAKDE